MRVRLRFHQQGQPFERLGDSAIQLLLHDLQRPLVFAALFQKPHAQQGCVLPAFRQCVQPRLCRIEPPLRQIHRSQRAGRAFPLGDVFRQRRLFIQRALLLVPSRFRFFALIREAHFQHTDQRRAVEPKRRIARIFHQQARHVFLCFPLSAVAHMPHKCFRKRRQLFARQPLLKGQKRVDIRVQGSGQRADQRHIRAGRARFPLADRRRAHAEPVSKGFLRHAACAAQFSDSRAELVVHPPRLLASIIPKPRVLRNGGVFNPHARLLNRRSLSV